ncbi:MAG: FkbM family methyltransferase [Pirellulales bacterium]
MSVIRSAAKQIVRILPEPVARGLLRTGIRTIPRAERTFLAAAHHVKYARPLVDKTSAGFAMELHLDDRIDRRIYYTGHYEVPTEALFRRLLPGAKCFVDIGANNGFFSLLAATLMGDDGRVFAFEPFSATYARLLRNIEVSGTSGVTPIKIALSNVAQRREMVRTQGTLGLSAFASGENEAAADESVECDTFDNFWARQRGGQIDLVKMDIEGAELLVLEGMSRSLSERIFEHLFVEVHPNQIRSLGGDPRSVADILTANGYHLFERRDGRLADVDIDAFFASDVGHRFILATRDESLRGFAVPRGF